MSVGAEVPADLELRALSVEDAPAVAEITNQVTLAEIGVPWTTVEEERVGLTAPGRALASAEAVLVRPDGRAEGFLRFVADPPFTEFVALVFVRPELWGQGLNALLLRLAEERAHEALGLAPPGERVVLHALRFADNEPAGRLFVSLGLERVRTFWMMRIELEDPPPAPRVPPGITIRTFVPERDEVAVHAALAEAFSDHWGVAFRPFERWRHEEIEGEGSGFDPGLWFLGTEGDEVVGAACCRASSGRSSDTAQVDDFAVRRPWRRRGVGLALLHTAFGEFHRRGIPRAELSVDAENITGATRLYERAGMHVAHSFEIWEKELRPASEA